jgi:hypothetical protein
MPQPLIGINNAAFEQPLEPYKGRQFIFRLHLRVLCCAQRGVIEEDHLLYSWMWPICGYSTSWLTQQIRNDSTPWSSIEDHAVIGMIR